MKRMMQFRFHGVDSQLNYPQSSSIYDWTTNLFFKYGMISHLGIQGEPGVIFYLNDGNNPIVLGNTGIYELDLEGMGRITGLRFDRDNLTTTYNNSFNETHRLIVDIIYDGPEVSV